MPQKAVALIDQINYYLLFVLAFALAFSRALFSISLGLIILIWLIKLLMGAVDFPRNTLTYTVLSIIAIIIIFFILLPNNWLGIERAEILVTPLICFLIISSTTISKAGAKKIINLFLCSMILAISFQLIRRLFVPYNELALAGGPNPTGELISMTCLILLTFLRLKTNRIKILINASFLFIALIGLYLNHSRGAWMGFMGGFLWMVFFVFKNKTIKKSLLLIGALVLVSLIVVPGLIKVLQSDLIRGYDNERILLWQTALKLFQSHPVFGIGLNMYQTYFHNLNPNIYVSNTKCAHNNFLQIMAEMGTVGLFVYLFLFFNIFRSVYYKIRDNADSYQASLAIALIGCAISLLIHGLVDFTLGMRLVMYVLMFLLGIIISLSKATAQKERLECND